jgi:hypothetical protein
VQAGSSIIWLWKASEGLQPVRRGFITALLLCSSGKFIMTVRFGKAPALAGIKKFFFRFFFRKGFYCGLLRIAEKHNRLRSYIFYTKAGAFNGGCFGRKKDQV